jgi:hypothetical protein
VVRDVPVDDETPVVTLGISRSVGAQSFRGAHRGRVCVRVFTGVSMHACCERLRCTMWFSQEKKKKHRIGGGVIRRFSPKIFGIWTNLNWNLRIKVNSDQSVIDIYRYLPVSNYKVKICQDCEKNWLEKRCIISYYSPRQEGIYEVKDGDMHFHFVFLFLEDIWRRLYMHLIPLGDFPVPNVNHPISAGFLIP